MEQTSFPAGTRTGSSSSGSVSSYSGSRPSSPLHYHALERGDHDTALTAAVEAIAIEPLRESAHSLVIRAHLVAGNHSDAVRAYRAYCRQLRQGLSIAPSGEMEGLLRPLLVPHSQTPHRT